MKQGTYTPNERTRWSAARALSSKGAHVMGRRIADTGLFPTVFGITTGPWPEESPL